MQTATRGTTHEEDPPVSSSEATPATRRHVPRYFEDAAAHWTSAGRARCDRCSREDLECWRFNDSPNPVVYCEECARRDHAGDLERENIVFATFEGIVKGLVEAEVSLELIRNAALDAIEQAERRERESIRQLIAP
jgi:hypothetical protein